MIPEHFSREVEQLRQHPDLEVLGWMIRNLPGGPVHEGASFGAVVVDVDKRKNFVL
jgi:hypothetical protein